jgi:DNA polymerase-3 subunit gamma/tau
VAAALADMAGATPPRLLLELLVARLLVVGSEAEAMTAARLERVERQLALIAAGGAQVAGPGAGSPTARPSATTEHATAGPAVTAAGSPGAVALSASPPVAASSPGLGPSSAEPAALAPAPAPADSSAAGDAPAEAASGGITVEAMRRSWDVVLDELRGIKRFTWTLVSQEAQVLAVDAQTLTLGFAKPGLVETFTNRGQGAVVREALLRATGVDRTVVASVDRRAGTDGGPGPASGPGGGRPRPETGTSSPDLTSRRDRSAPPDPPDPPEPSDPPDDLEPPSATAAGPRRPAASATPADADGAALVRRLLGAEVIEESHGG